MSRRRNRRRQTPEEEAAWVEVLPGSRGETVELRKGRRLETRLVPK